SKDEDFERFRNLLEASWPGVSIKKPEWEGFDQPLRMFYSENRRDREIYWAGYGFQVWLQILTHILRTDNEFIIVMDEPDVYLHADLQKRLLKIIDKHFSQYFLATHSTELINEADLGAVASINPSRRSAKRIVSDEDFQAVYNYVGSSENAELAKLVRAKRIIFFEGEDKRLIKRFAAKLGFSTIERDTEALIVATGGFSQWRRVSDADWALRQILQIEADIFAVFDRDYRCNLELNEVKTELSKRGVCCEIWGRKEIENYLLHEGSLIRHIKRKLADNNPSVSHEEIVSVLLGLTNMYGSYVRESFLEHQSRGWAGQRGTDEEAARLTEEIDRKWSTLEGRFSIIPGKRFISDLCGHFKEHYNVSITPLGLLDEIKPQEIDDDMKIIIKKLSEFCSDEVATTLEVMVSH
ncbi:MAG: ATP-binding protein, partial [Proteobacteria bacterium]